MATGTVVARGYGSGTLLSSEFESLSIDACCPSAIPLYQFVNDTVCSGEPITVTNNSSGNNLTYFWEYEGGTSTAATPTFSIGEGGTYDVTLTVTGDSCFRFISEKRLRYLICPRWNLVTTPPFAMVIHLSCLCLRAMTISGAMEVQATKT